MARVKIWNRTTGKAYFVDRNNDEFMGDNNHDSYYNHVINGEDVAYEYHRWSGRITGSGHQVRLLNKNFTSKYREVGRRN